MTPVCPVQAFKCYDSIRPRFIGTCFRHLSGSPVTRYQFTAVLKKALSCLGIDNYLYTSHCFRIGAATSYAMFGFSNEEISAFGRSKSQAFKTYIRISTTSFK